MQASDKKRSREDRDIVHRLRPFAKLQTAADYEVFAADVLCKCDMISNQIYILTIFSDEALLRQRIQELQQYRRLGLVTAADIEKYKSDLQKRVSSVRSSLIDSSRYFRRPSPKPIIATTQPTSIHIGASHPVPTLVVLVLCPLAATPKAGRVTNERLHPVSLAHLPGRVLLSVNCVSPL